MYIFTYQTCICIILCGEKERGKFRGFSNCVLFHVCEWVCLKFKFLLKLLKWNHWYVFRITLPYKHIWTAWKWGLQWFTGEISFEQKRCKKEATGKGKTWKNRVVRRLIRLHTKLLEEKAHFVKSLIKLLKIGRLGKTRIYMKSIVFGHFANQTWFSESEFCASYSAVQSLNFQGKFCWNVQICG